MPRCGDVPGYDTCGSGHLSGCTKYGAIEDWQQPERILEEEEEWVCPLNCSDPDSRPWTLYYLTTVAMEKSLKWYRFLTVTVYGDSYHWGMVKAIFLFGFGIRFFLQLARKLHEACEKRKKCQEMKRKYNLM